MKKGEHRRSYDMYMSVARFTGVVPLLLLLLLLMLRTAALYCADAFEIQRKCGLDLSLVVSRMAALPLFLRLFLVPTAAGPCNDTHAHTRTLTNPHAEAPFVAVTKGKA